MDMGQCFNVPYWSRPFFCMLPLLDFRGFGDEVLLGGTTIPGLSERGFLWY